MDEAIDYLLEIVEQILQSGEDIPDELLSEVTQILNEYAQEHVASSAPSIPNSVSLLWTLAGGDEDAFISYLRTFPDAELNALARRPEQLIGIIEQLSSRVTQSHGEVIDGVPKADLNSSNIFGMSYNPGSKKLFVKFQGNGGYGDGPVYEYEGVPPAVFKIFRNGAIPAKTNGQNRFGRWWRGKSPSLGASFWNLIRDRFPYQKVA